MDPWSGFKSFAGNLLRGEFDVEGSRRGFEDTCASLGVSAETGKAVVDASANVLLGERVATPVVSLTSTLVVPENQTAQKTARDPFRRHLCSP